MKIKLPLLLALFLLHFLSAFGQTNAAKNDTVYIYEELIVYDTIYVYDTIKEVSDIEGIYLPEPRGINLLQLNTINNNANLLMISGAKTATIPIDGIILSRNNKNLESMKKLSFLGVMCFAFQTMVLAQADYGLSTGGGIWWSKCNSPFVKGEQIAKVAYSPNFSAGVYYKQYFKSGISLETQLNYQLLISNYSYKSFYPASSTFDPALKYYDILWDDLSSPFEILIVEGEKIYTSRIVGEEASTINYHQIEIPFQAGYIFGKFNPYMGIKYSLRMFNLSETEIINDDGEDITQIGFSKKKGLNSFQSCLGLEAGLSMAITDKLSLGLSYYHAFTNDFTYTGYLLDRDTDEIVSKDDYHWKSRSLEISVSYSLKGNGKEE